MIAAAALAALLAAAQPAPDLGLHPPALGPQGPRLGDPGPFSMGELLGSGAGVLAADTAFLGLAVGAYELVTTHAVAPTLGTFRTLGIGLALSALVLPPLGATLGAMLGGRHGAGAAWKAFLLALAGNAAALVAGYYTAPAFWAILPVQLATMTAAASLGLHWGRMPVTEARTPPAPAETAPRDAAAALPAGALAWGPPMCLDAGAR